MTYKTASCRFSVLVVFHDRGVAYTNAHTKEEKTHKFIHTYLLNISYSVYAVDKSRLQHEQHLQTLIYMKITTHQMLLTCLYTYVILILYGSSNNGVVLCYDVRIEAFDDAGVSMGLLANYSDIPAEDVMYYLIGNGPQKVSMWEPWTGYQDAYILPTFLEAIANFVISKRSSPTPVDNTSPYGVDTISVEMWCVGWTAVESTPVCVTQGDGNACPDIIILGTTQIAARVSAGEAYSLEDYFASYTYNTGNVLSDDFLRPYFYEYYFVDGWYAVPLVSDTRSLFFNTTTFDQLGLMYPPPYGNWTEPYSDSWTWELFSNYSKIISDSGIGRGFDFYGCFDEEYKIMMMVAQSWNVQILYKNNNTCGLRNPRFVGAMQATVERWLHDDDSMSPLFGVPDDQLSLLSTWTDTYYPALQPPQFLGRCRDAATDPPIVGMAIETTFLIGTYENSAVKIAYPPGHKSFLGGSGMMITSGGNNKDLAWDLISYFVDTQNRWLSLINLRQFSVPPYDSALSQSPWNTPAWAIPQETLRNSVPAQYPLSTFPQYKLLESIHPIRLMWMEIEFKNYSIAVAVERACELIDQMFMPACDYNIQFRACINFPYTATIVIVCVSVTSFLVAGALVLLGLFIRHHDAAPIRHSSWRFSLVIIFGSILAYSYVYLSFGTPSDAACKIRIWALVLGFVLVFGSISLKLYRVYVLFQSSLGSVLKRELPDKLLLMYLGVLVIIEVGLLFGWTFSPDSGVSIYTELVSGYGNAPYLMCGAGDTAFTVVIFCYNALITLWGCSLCWLTRGVPSEFNEKKFMFYSLVSTLLCCVVLVPVIFTFPDKYWATILSVIGILFATTISLWVFCFPKLSQIYWPTKNDRTIASITPSPGEVVVVYSQIDHKEAAQNIHPL